MERVALRVRDRVTSRTHNSLFNAHPFHREVRYV